MPFLRLGKTNINYIKTTGNDLYILSDIIESQLSPELPKIIRSSDELQLYFGDSWDQYGYYAQLIDSGVSLCLYKPLLDSRNQGVSGYLGVEFWPIVEVSDFNHLPGEELNESLKPKNNTRYWVKDEDHYYIYSTDTWDSNENGYFGDYIKDSDIPENFSNPENSSSWLNRDSLRLTIPQKIVDIKNPGFSESNIEFIEYIYPKFSYLYNNQKFGVDFSEILFPNDIETGESRNFSRDSVLFHSSVVNSLHDNVSFAINLEFPENYIFKNNYIVLLIAEDPINSFTIMISINDTDEVSLKIFDKNIDETYYRKTKWDTSSLSLICDLLNNTLGFKATLLGNTISIISDKLLRVNRFSNIPGYSVSKDIDKNLEILTWATLDEKQSEDDGSDEYIFKIDPLTKERIILNKYYASIDFYSRLLGTDPENRISVLIENLEDHRHRVTISKLGYSEIFEGSYGFVDNETDNFESLINLRSNLVYCHINHYYKHYSDGSESEYYPELREGTWELSGGKTEKVDSKSMWVSLNILKESTIQEDFLLIPDIQKWRTKELSQDYDYYLEYIDFLDYAKTKNCQILIQNNDLNESQISDRSLPWNNEFVFNYKDDSENRLLYFYKDYLLSTFRKRPGYYFFLQGALFNQWSIGNRVLYRDIEGDDSVFETSELSLALVKYKSNYLSDYNNQYAYKKFLWGSKYETSGTLRFVLSRISRIFMRYKWDILGYLGLGRRESYIKDLLSSIRELNNSLIYSLYLDSMIYSDDQTNLLIWITLRSREFLEKDIKLNITLNYIY